jgi:hypothetical protein
LQTRIFKTHAHWHIRQTLDTQQRDQHTVEAFTRSNKVHAQQLSLFRVWSPPRSHSHMWEFVWQVFLFVSRVCCHLWTCWQITRAHGHSHVLRSIAVVTSHASSILER